MLPEDEKSFRQLLLPQVKPLAQWESKSQSPPPTLQGEDVEQQLQSVDGTPSHCPGVGVVGAGGAVGVARPIVD